MLKSKKKVIVSLSIILFIVLLAFLVYKSSNYTLKEMKAMMRNTAIFH